MLNKFRGFADTWPAKILMGLIALSFLSWGITGYILNGGQNPVVAKFGKAEINLAQFSNEYKRQIMQIEKMSGGNLKISNDMKEALVFQVLENMKYRLLMDQKAKDLGFVMTKEAIFEVIKQQNEFKDKNGNFSYEIYNRIMSYNNVSEKMFYQEIENQNGRFILTSLLQTGIAVPLIYVDFAYNFAYQVRDVKYVAVDFNSVKFENINDEQLKVAYEQNKHLFATPEYREIVYIQILPEHVGGANADALLKKAEEVENEIIGGMSFEEVAKSQNVAYGKLPYMTIGMMQENGSEYSNTVVSKDLIKQVFEINEGQETSLIENNSGYIIMSAKNVKPVGFLPLTQVKDKIVKIARETEQNKLAYVKANEILTDIKSGKAVDLKSMNISRNDKNADEQLISKAFTTPNGEWFIAKNKDSYVVGKVDSIKSPEKNNEQIAKVAELLKKQLPDLVMQDYMKYLEKEMGVKTYPDKVLNVIE